MLKLRQTSNAIYMYLYLLYYRRKMSKSFRFMVKELLNDAKGL